MASYAPAFTSFAEMNGKSSEIRRILSKWGSRYLLGDVGITSINYANWGILNGNPVCIDYAYIFPVSMDIFECVCGNKDMRFSGSDYTKYQCCKCYKTYSDRELRARISNEERLRLFSDVLENGIEMHDPIEEHDAPVRQSTYVNPSGPDPREVGDTVVQWLRDKGRSISSL